VVPGLPVIGNLLQLKEKKPHKTFTKMAHKYGPIFSIKAGASTIIVLNTAQLAKEVGCSLPINHSATLLFSHESTTCIKLFILVHFCLNLLSTNNSHTLTFCTLG